MDDILKTHIKTAKDCINFALDFEDNEQMLEYFLKSALEQLIMAEIYIKE